MDKRGLSRDYSKMKSLGRQLNLNIFFIVITSLFMGLSIVVLSLRFDYSTLFIFVFGLPLGLLIFKVLPIAISKIKNLTVQLRWWHILWLFVFLSGLVFRTRDVETIQESSIDFWAFYRIGLMILVAFVLLEQLIIRRLIWIKSLFYGLIGLLAGYALMNMISTLWSVYSTWTLYKSIEYLTDVALIAAIVTSMESYQEFKTLFDWTWVLTGLIMASVWLGVLVWPEQAIFHGVGLVRLQIQGVLPQVSANGVGYLGAILGIVALTRLLLQPKHKQFYLIVFFVSMAILVLSQSRSPLTGFLVALPLVLFVSKRIGILALSAGLVMALLFLTNADNLFWKFFQRGQDPELFASLSGRVSWWKLGWNFFKEHPFIGYGAYVGGRFIVLSKLGFTTTASIHSTWLEVLLGVGLIGLQLIVGVLLGTWVILLRFVFQIKEHNLLHHLTVEAIGVLVILSVGSFFSPQFIWHPPLEFLLILGYVEFLRRNYGKIIYESTARTQPLPSARW
jgi:hypothetical protein